jgi:hypothetical protein
MDSVIDSSVINCQSLIPRQMLGVEQKRKNTEGRTNSATDKPAYSLVAVAVNAGKE